MKDLEKTINEAARECVDKCYPASQDAPFIAEGFRKGAEWMLNNFKENIWHDADEEPYADRCIICKNKDDDKEYYELDFTDKYYPWELLKKDKNIIQWCYLSGIVKEN